MIDFVKFKYYDREKLIDFITHSDNFTEVNDVHDIKTGDIKQMPFAMLGTLKIITCKDSAYVKNSLHYLYNFLNTGISHNYNDFCFSKLNETIDYLVNNLIDLDSTRITQFEFGLNLDINRLPENIVKRNVLLHKKIAGSINRFFGKGEYKQFTHTNFFIKVYDKGKQNSLGTNIFRLEVKLIRRREFSKLGVNNVLDFKSKSTLYKCFKYFMMRFEELVILDDFDETTINSERDYLKLSRYTNHVFWSEELRGKHPQVFARHREEFNTLLLKHNLLKTKDYLRTKLIEKFNTLINE